MNRDEAVRVMKVLTAAYPTYPYPPETDELYLMALTEQNAWADGPLALQVAVDWSMTKLTFPKPAEIVTEIQGEVTRRSRRQTALAAAQVHRHPGTVACRRCDDSGMIEEQGDRGYVWARPCPACCRDEAQYWAEGHYDLFHDVFVCDHPRCVDRAKSYRGKHMTSPLGREENRGLVGVTPPASLVEQPF